MTVEQVFRCLVSSPSQVNWDLVLPVAQFALNSTHHAATGHIASYVAFGREPELPLEAAVCDVVDGPVQSVVDCVATM